MKIDLPKTPPEIASYRNQRRGVGILGIILPFALIIISFTLGCTQIQPSISQYFYTTAGMLLVGVLCAVGLFLISYKGPQKIDDVVTNFAGVCALGIAFLPTGTDLNSHFLLFTYSENKTIALAHYLFAALFFVSLAANSYFLFTRSDNSLITEQKQTRNKIYRTCGILMLIFAALIPLGNINLFKQYLDGPYTTFILESLALITFGISWLIKGDTFIQDEKNAKMVKAKATDIVPANAK